MEERAESLGLCLLARPCSFFRFSNLPFLNYTELDAFRRSGKPLRRSLIKPFRIFSS